jgi:hypothetical protein
MRGLQNPSLLSGPWETMHVMVQPSQDGHAANFQEACELWTRRGDSPRLAVAGGENMTGC